MKPLHNLANEALNLELLEHLLLTVLRVYDLIELECFPHHLRGIVRLILVHTIKR